MEQKKDRPDAGEIAPKPRSEDQGRASSKPGTKLQDDVSDDEDRIDGGAAIANDRLNSANDE